MVLLDKLAAHAKIEHEDLAWIEADRKVRRLDVAVQVAAKSIIYGPQQINNLRATIDESFTG